jgi:hypothetical protein
MKVPALIITLLVMLLPTWALGESLTVRDAQGRVVERRYVSGNVVKIYGPTGRLIRVETVTAMPDGRPVKPGRGLEGPPAASARGEYELTRVRDPRGKLLRKQRSTRRADGSVVTRVTDRRGRLLEKRNTTVRADGAHITRIKDRKGALQEKRITKDGVTKVYGPRGNLLRTEWTSPARPKKRTRRKKATRR